MTDIKEYKKGVIVQLIIPLTLSQNKNWICYSNHILKYRIKYATVNRFHHSIKEAVQIEYRYENIVYNTYVNYKDTIIIDEMPSVRSKPVMFDKNNLDI